MRRQVSVLITDLDNTLFDWVDAWYRSFSAMLRVLVDQSGIPQDALEREIREIHRRHGTSEYAFLLEELLSSLQEQHPNADIAGLQEPAIQAYRQARDEHLALYPTVSDTLRTIKAQGSVIVGYTESMAFYTGYRLRGLGLDGLIDYLYSPPDHDLPKGQSAEHTPTRSATCEVQSTIHRHTPKGAIKPNAAILGSIIHELGATPSKVVYVGDSLMKDIAMANQVGVFSALAKYGEAQNRQEYELLRRVSYWTDEDIAREKEIIFRSTVEPTAYLHRSLAELLMKFEFVAFDQPATDDSAVIPSRAEL